MEIKQEKYELIRPLMKTGDLLLFQSDEPVGKGIRAFTRKVLEEKGITYEQGNPLYDVNHCAMIIRLGELEGPEMRVFMSESVLPVVTLTTLSKKANSYHGRIFWIPLIDSFLPFRALIGHEALEMLGIPYDKWGVFQSMFGHTTCDETALFCSEYYLLALWKVLTPGHRSYEALYPGEIVTLNYHNTQRLEEIIKEE